VAAEGKGITKVQFVSFKSNHIFTFLFASIRFVQIFYSDPDCDFYNGI